MTLFMTLCGALIFCSLNPLEASEDKPKAPPPTEIMPFKFKYYKFLSIFKYNSNLVSAILTRKHIQKSKTGFGERNVL